jgi:hypothetical protein
MIKFELTSEKEMLGLGAMLACFLRGEGVIQGQLRVQRSPLLSLTKFQAQRSITLTFTVWLILVSWTTLVLMNTSAKTNYV